MQSNHKRQPALNDTDPMPFGKHKGEPMQDVPARYLQWLWNDGMKDFSRNIKPEDKFPEWTVDKTKLANYIWNSQDAIAQETGEEL